MSDIDLRDLRRAYNTGYEAISGGLSMSVEAHESGLRAVEAAVREQIARDFEEADMPYAAGVARGES